jgi:hypothetical protein
MSKPLPVQHEEDFETWDHYHKYPELRWVFNKLEVALKQDLHAGPAGTAPQKEGWYISRPIYNIFGMGISAEKIYYTHDMHHSFVNHGVVKPGHFWCEWLDGPQYSLDYRLFTDKIWRCTSITCGYHFDDTNLTKFQKWVKIPVGNTPKLHELPVFPQHETLTGVNVEMRQGKILEIHLRLGNDPFDHLPVGTQIFPIWEDTEIPSDAEIMKNLYDDMELYSASGNLSNIRSGYIIIRP